MKSEKQSHWFSSSGGVVYHLRALISFNSLWKSHRIAVNTFLKEWQAFKLDSHSENFNKIILIGPSGGYSLSKTWLSQFKTLIAFEPDPLARFIFEKRMGLKPIWIKTPFDLEDENSFVTKEELKTPAVFCNVLGQLNFKNESLALENLIRFLEPRPFASYHDAWSGKKVRFQFPQESFLTRVPLKERIQIKTDQTHVELNEHLPLSWFEYYANKSKRDFRFRYWEWQLTGKKTHLIEGVSG